MSSRLAYTAGGMVVTLQRSPTRIPAGACWIDRDTAAPNVCTVRWSERGIDYSARLSGEELREYVLGCIVQYA
jgi:hypothetical protein